MQEEDKSPFNTYNSCKVSINYDNCVIHYVKTGAYEVESDSSGSSDEEIQKEVQEKPRKNQNQKQRIPGSGPPGSNPANRDKGPSEKPAS